jgi:hypothetical protein
VQLRRFPIEALRFLASEKLFARAAAKGRGHLGQREVGDDDVCQAGERLVQLVAFGLWHEQLH